MYQINSPLLLLFIAMSLMSPAQSWNHIDRAEYESLTLDARKLFEGEMYSYQISYCSYIGHESEQPHDQAKGHIVRRGKEYFADIPGNRSAQGDGLRIMMDDDEKLIVLLDPDYKLDQTVAKAFYESMFLYADSLVTRTAGSDRYIRFYYGEKSEFYCQEIQLDSRGLPTEITIYYRDELALQPEEESTSSERPKLVINLTNLKLVSEFPAEYKIESFLKKTSKGYAGIGNYVGYQIVDYRY